MINRREKLLKNQQGCSVFLFFVFLQWIVLAENSVPSFPTCENLFSDLELSLQDPKVESESFRKQLFKIVNEKRTEASRYVRHEVESYRKNREQELKDFDVETKKMKLNLEEKNKRRDERKKFSAQIQSDKKNFNKNLFDQEKKCQSYLNEQKEIFLAKIKDIKKSQTASSSKKTSFSSPELEEFKEIPKGPGTVLKPQ